MMVYGNWWRWLELWNDWVELWLSRQVVKGVEKKGKLARCKMENESRGWWVVICLFTVFTSFTSGLLI